MHYSSVYAPRTLHVYVVYDSDAAHFSPAAIDGDLRLVVYGNPPANNAAFKRRSVKYLPSTTLTYTSYNVVCILQHRAHALHLHVAGGDDAVGWTMDDPYECCTRMRLCKARHVFINGREATPNEWEQLQRGQLPK